MSKPVSIAVVIVNLDGGGCLERCLQALNNQSQPPAKVILVDNGSKDNSLEIAARLCPDSVVIRLDRNLGFAAPNNIGVRAADGVEWVALLNNDAFCEPAWIETLSQAVEANPGYSSFASRIVSDKDPNVLDSAGDVYHASGFAWHRLHGQPEAEFAKRPLEVFSASGTAVLYNRSAFLELGGFDEDFFCYWEDVDLGFRLRLRGHRSLYVPTAAVRHIGSRTGGEKSDFSLYYGHRNLVWTFFKDMPSPLLWWYLPQHLIFNFLSACWYAVKGQGGPVLRAKADALKAWRTLLKKRASVQETRTTTALQIRQGMARGLLLTYHKSKRFSYADRGRRRGTCAEL